MIEFWQHLPERISPYLFTFGSFQVRYYSLMYVVAFLLTYVLVLYRTKREQKYACLTVADVQDVLLWCIIGVLLGGRLGYVLFYNPLYYLAHPLEIFLPFEISSSGVRFVGISGMSFHGGAIGVILCSWYLCKRRGWDFWFIADLFAPAVPLGYTFGRFGNFINGELYGRPTEMPWGMYFPADTNGLLRHPSQLYEALSEGIFLFLILWFIRTRSPFEGLLLSLYIIGYGLVRFFVEFFREPDPHLGFLGPGLTMGQILCLFMVLCGGYMLVYRSRFFKSFKS
ncbi:MAG: prolipoprotein diacylglyceryl transferase [Syntrophales bacterium]|nr:prolipoprotein diacylglyceryl transferase [Syntrophales bacterium]